MAVCPGRFADDNSPIRLLVTFCPPDKRHRDRTNCEASMKSAFDGIADALGVNDRRFEPTYRWGEPVAGGAVTVEIGGVA
jgi:crossover junction endodeoxyribonuclease RusA